MNELTIQAAEECGYDLVALGEVMLRLDPGEGRIRTARSFQAWEGGGEYNVARGLRRCFGLRTGIATALVDNDIGRLIEDFMLQGGVDTSLVRWIPHDGIGRTVRNGLNFTERGFGVRGALGTSDRGNSAASQLAPGQFDWDALFGETRVRWLHTGGIFAALSASTPAVLEEAMTAARRYGTVVSYDLNYRPSLWKANGNLDASRDTNRQLAEHVDVLIGNREQLTACLGIESEDVELDLESERETAMSVMSAVSAACPNISVIATTLRAEHSASVNDWGALAWSRDSGFVEATERPGLEILDRVGGGDGFAAGLIYGLLQDEDLLVATEYGAAHGALTMTTPGDSSTSTLAEVKALAGSQRSRIQR